MTNGLGGVKALWTDIDAILNAVAAEYTERVIQLGQALISRIIAAVCQEAICLQQARWANKTIRVPPE